MDPCVRRVLVVDDDRDLAEVVSMVVRDLGHEVALAHSGTQALERLGAGTSFDLMISDFHLTDLDGLELAARVRAIHPPLRILLLTGDAHRLDPADPRMAPIARCLGKPIELEALEQAITALLPAPDLRTA